MSQFAIVQFIISSTFHVLDMLRMKCFSGMPKQEAFGDFESCPHNNNLTSNFDCAFANKLNYNMFHHSLLQFIILKKKMFYLPKLLRVSFGR